MNFTQVIEKYRKEAFSERDKGARFERLIKAFFLAVPMYKTTFETVWLWNEFPYREEFGGRDIGIDLVAKTTSGEYWSIQCKCYAEDAYINKEEVDSFIATSGKRFHDKEQNSQGFSCGIFVATSRNFSDNVNTAFENQSIDYIIITLDDLEKAAVDWAKLDKEGKTAVLKERKLLEHQQEALSRFHEHFKTEDRGKLIMACGTGKTFTSLRIAEKEAPDGLVLFLVPSIALLGQTLEEWATYAEKPIKPICICSDAEVSARRKSEDDTVSGTLYLPFPATTDVDTLIKHFEAMRAKNPEGMTVVFSTYQSIERVSEMQRMLNKRKEGSAVFDLIVCDEAHRTTGVALSDGNGGHNESAFIRVHDDEFLRGRKRLYMTATPRLYKFSDEVKNMLRESDAYLCSMDDEAMYGKEVYRIGFGRAVEKGLLSDYKVLVLTMNSKDIPPEMREAVKNSNGEIQADDISQLIGCINALSKRAIREEDLIRAVDPAPMHTAVAFCPSIKLAKHYTAVFNEQKELFYNTLPPEERIRVVSVEADHVNGGMGAVTRQKKLAWMKSVPKEGNECRIITNVKCLSEGVDVPSLDAVLFLSAKNSQVDIVQSVGRVMRRAEGKKYGYIIVPVVIPEEQEPEDALDRNERFAVVWSILKALRAHDDRLDVEINKLDLNKIKSGHIIISDGSGGGAGNNNDKPGSGSGSGGVEKKEDKELSETEQMELISKFDNFKNAIYARIVKKVGTRNYWDLWAKDIAKLAEHHIGHIKELVTKEGAHREEFAQFLAGLRRNLNPSVSEDEAVEMLAQHLITRPVFDALFENYSFVQNNAVSISMQKMLELLHDSSPYKDAEVMAKFIKSIQERVEGIDNAEGRQKIIVELYDKFFKAAFPKAVEKLGIVYTPVEIVDFILQSVADVLKKEFGRTLSDENVHILDPFTGTGTFLTRLIQSKLIRPEDLKRKYLTELHANEIVLLAYYIASVNIENVFHDAAGEGQYTPFDGICLADTFQMTEPGNDNNLPSDAFRRNSERVEKQKSAPIRIIIGNPPYSMGQNSGNDNAKNQKYPELEKHIASTYAAGSKASTVNSLYDSYIKAFRWATDRLEEENGGIIAFVSNGTWIDGNAASGFRKCLEKEFSAIYVFNLRGNQRTRGELSRKEGGKIFGAGSRAPISITLLVKRPEATGKAEIFYHDIGDYLSREEKLKRIKKFGTILNPAMNLVRLTPNEHGDWLNQRNDAFSGFIPIEPEKKFDGKSKSFFTVNSLGLNSSRDVWVYSFSETALKSNARKFVDFYNSQVNDFLAAKAKDPKLEAENFISYDSRKIKWSSSLIPRLQKGETAKFQPEKIAEVHYRPFCKEKLYFGDKLIHRRGQWEELFPTPNARNLIISVSGISSQSFSVFITDVIQDSNILEAGAQCFPLYYYEKKEQEQLGLFDSTEGDYIRHDGVSDFILERCREKYGPKTTKEEVFFYVYGLLHSPDYRKAFSADLKKMLPRIPLVESPAEFKAFVKAGRDLAELHLNYETQPKPQAVNVTGEDAGIYTVRKMTFGKRRDSASGKLEEDRSRILYNEQIEITGIPEAAYGYVVNGKSAIEWLMERYQVKTDKDTEIMNDPNQWAKEHNNPQYILKLLLSVIQVSLRTQEIVTKLPTLKF